MSLGLAVGRWGFTTTFVATAGIAATGAVLALDDAGKTPSTTPGTAPGVTEWRSVRKTA